MSDYSKWIKEECKDGRFINYQKGYLKVEPSIVKFLKKILAERYETNSRLSVLDVASGIGYVSHYTSQLFPEWSFTCIDYEKRLIECGCELIRNPAIQFYQGDLYELGDLQLGGDFEYDIVILWMTLWVLDDIQRVFALLRSRTKKYGRVYISSLFHDFEVDIEAYLTDYTLPTQGYRLPYRTFSKKHFEEKYLREGWDITWHPFEIDVDLPQSGKGTGTFTEKLADGRRLQISGGYLMSWNILELRKL